ncbi:SpoIIE family protein phosphatase [Virgibacillus dokdonensis]|uniref:SpoIIE family protein phosphatase n=1 Tax=Virgibacillus dokdonensis TaxID=302167 RepID=UPI00098BA2BA|nr:SpoIIE family protein phosphatase [Virgibacillus dokdonensis]
MGQVKVSVFQQAKTGNYYCGDSFFYEETNREFVCAIADGLGSGEIAKESSQVVIDIIQNNIHASIESIIKECNQQLQGKRGVVIGILKLDFQAEMYSFSSIGNIGVLTITDHQHKKRNIPNAGYLAGFHRPFKIVREKLLPDMVFIMFSDGVTDRDLSQKYLLTKNVQEITETFKCLASENRSDDTTLIAMHYRGTD